MKKNITDLAKQIEDEKEVIFKLVHSIGIEVDSNTILDSLVNMIYVFQVAEETGEANGFGVDLFNIANALRFASELATASQSVESLQKELETLQKQ